MNPLQPRVADPYDKLRLRTAVVETLGAIAPPKLDAMVHVVEDWNGTQSALRWWLTKNRLRQDALRGHRIRRSILAQYDLGAVYTIWPGDESYDTMSRWKPAPRFERTKVGKEVLSEQPTTHWRCITTNLAPLEYVVEIWLTEDGIPMRIDSHVTQRCDGMGVPSEEDTHRCRWLTQEVIRQPVEAARFELSKELKPRHLRHKPVFNVGELSKNTLLRSGRING